MNKYVRVIISSVKIHIPGKAVPPYSLPNNAWPRILSAHPESLPS